LDSRAAIVDRRARYSRRACVLAHAVD
jgi:hypothetical protein